MRVHTDPLSQQASAAIGARAFAYGADIFLGAGESAEDVELMSHEMTHVVQQGGAAQRAAQRKVEVGKADSPAEREADAVAAAVVTGSGGERIVSDDVESLGGEQMRKSEFLAMLRVAVTAAANAELGSEWTADECPYIEQYLAYYAGKPAAHIERASRAYAPEAAHATTATAMIAPIVARVRRGVQTWVISGRLPSDAASIAPSGVAVAADAAVNEGSDDDSSSGEQLSADTLQRKQSGQSLDSVTAARMGDAFGTSFEDVRVHVSPAAAKKAAAADAAAFTVGSDVWFGAGEFNPGSPDGDALLAHELAHVVQQRGAQRSAKPTRDSESGHEEDADQAAESALARIYGGAKERASLAFTTGFSLQRCKSGESKKDKEKRLRAARKRANKQSKKDAAKIAKPSIAMNDKAVAGNVIKAMDKANEDGDLDSGIHYYFGYRKICEDKGKMNRWEDDYYKGHADPNYWIRIGAWRWRVRPGMSAAVALQNWIKGPTIAECLSTVDVLNMDAMRATLGAKRFDELFSSLNKAPEKELLTVGVGTTTLSTYQMSVGSGAADSIGTIGNRSAEQGVLYYFCNHPKYLLKHPGGAWQGENALYIGKKGSHQKWSGFGASDVSERELLVDMVEEYNNDRDDDDKRALAQIKKANGGVVPDIYMPGKGHFDKKITVKKLLDAPAYTLDGTTRKGGFTKGGFKLDLKKVEQLK